MLVYPPEGGKGWGFQAGVLKGDFAFLKEFIEGAYWRNCKVPSIILAFSSLFHQITEGTYWWNCKVLSIILAFSSLFLCSSFNKFSIISWKTFKNANIIAIPSISSFNYFMKKAQKCWYYWRNIVVPSISSFNILPKLWDFWWNDGNMQMRLLEYANFWKSL